MVLKGYSIKMDGHGGYLGYSCVVMDDSGKEHAVLAYARQHSSISSITKAAFEAVKDEAVAVREAQIEKAAEIMKQVEAEKATREEPPEVPEEPEILEGEATEPGLPSYESDESSSFGAPPVFEGEDHLEEPTLEEAPADLADYTLPVGDPDLSWLKGEIKLYLFQNKISYDEGMTKPVLLKQVPPVD